MPGTKNFWALQKAVFGTFRLSFGAGNLPKSWPTFSHQKNLDPKVAQKMFLSPKFGNYGNFFKSFTI
jgi:hypothetical protein